MAGISLIRKWVTKQLTKPNAEGIMKIPDKGNIDFGEMLIKERLFTSGIDEKLIKSEKQLERFLDSFEAQRKQTLKRDFDEHVGTTRTGEKNYLYTPKKVKKPSAKIIEVDFDKGRWNKAGGGLAKKLIQEIIRKYKGRIDDRLLNQMLADDNPQRLAEVMATVDEALIMQQKGIKPDQIVETVKESFKRKKQAQGGRTGLSYLLAEDTNERMPFSKGKIADLARRGFLKTMGAGAAGIAALKSGLLGFGKGATKQVAKDLTSVPIGDPPGMPPWFKPLVNRVIKEGDDMTKQFATKEREIVHATKIGDDDYVRVTQDLDSGNVRVEYEGTNTMGEQSVQLEYKASEEIPLKGGKGSARTTDEFSAVESEPRVMNWDGDIEWDGENVVSEVKDLMSDTSKLKQYGTGKPLSKKELAIAKQKQEKVNRMNENQGAQGDFIEEKYGPAPDDVPDHIPSGYDKMKSGGIARMIGE